MKKLIFTIVIMAAFTLSSHAQDNSSSEKYGNTLNLGLGIGYYGYVGRSIPVGIINYEFDVAKNFTLAPFIGFYSYQNYYYWENPNKPKKDPHFYRKYSYRETNIPLGVKGTYYFDQLFKANSKWDFYAAGSLGFVYRRVAWEDGYYGDQYAYHKSSALFLDVHVGAEYHLSQKIGLYLDLSTGISTVGLAVHF